MPPLRKPRALVFQNFAAFDTVFTGLPEEKPFEQWSFNRSVTQAIQPAVAQSAGRKYTRHDRFHNG
jgi:hypothetical protein